jgi:hypothetical protein
MEEVLAVNEENGGEIYYLHDVLSTDLACCLLGLYYVPAAGAEWLMTAPSFDSIVIHGDTDLTIQAVNNAPTNNYINSIQLNGSAYPSFVISGQTLVAGNQTITITLTNSPVRIGNLYLSSADGDLTSCTGDNSSYLAFDIDPMAASCSAQVYSTSEPSSLTLSGVTFPSWTYDPNTKLATLTGMTKGSYRVSGSGVFARDADTIITLTEHEEEGCYAVEMTLRNLPPQPAFVVEWDFPVMVERRDLDPADLKRTDDVQEDDLEPLVELLDEKPLTTGEWQAAAERDGYSRATFYRMKQKLVAAKRVTTDQMSIFWT